MAIPGKGIKEIVEENFYIKTSFSLSITNDKEKRKEIEEAYEKMVNPSKKPDEEMPTLSIQDERVIFYYNEYMKGHPAKTIAINNAVSVDTVYLAIRIIKSLIKKLN